MTLETTLYYVTHHSEAIIQWLFLTILILSGILIARSLFAKKSKEEASSAAASQDIEPFLQKILEQISKIEKMPVASMTPEGAAQADVLVQQLKKDLASREQELAALKAGGQSQAPAEAEKLAQRIKELESKLAEYEILEDDIADLSLYKEENARLRVELEKFKSEPSSAIAQAVAAEVTPAVQAAASAPATAPPPTVVAAEPPPGDDIVAEFAQAVSQETMPSATPPIQVAESGDPLKDFESVMSMSEPPAPPAPPVMEEVAIPAPPEPPAPLVSAHKPTSPAKLSIVPAAAASAEGDDLFAEFSHAEQPAAEGGLDTDKMMAEMASLVNMEPAQGSALDENIDTDKMALEASTLTKS